jgi:hypothetical protein
MIFTERFDQGDQLCRLLLAEQRQLQRKLLMELR